MNPWQVIEERKREKEKLKGGVPIRWLISHLMGVNLVTLCSGGSGGGGGEEAFCFWVESISDV